MAHLPDDHKPEGTFSTHVGSLPLSPLFLERMAVVAEEATALLAGRASDLACGSEGESCSRVALAELARRAWRRPVTHEELDRIEALYRPLPAGARFGAAVQGMLLAPQFVLRTEIGVRRGAAPERMLEGAEIANALSYSITDGPPDHLLQDLAAQGALGDPTVREQQARRLVASSAGKLTTTRFLGQWLGVNAVATMTKDPEAFPLFSRALASELEEEWRLLIEDVGLSGGWSIRDLLLAPVAFVGPRTAALYGVPAPASGHRRTTLNPEHRLGVLTQGAYLSAHASFAHTSAAARGFFIREELLCQDIPPPPDDVDLDAKGSDPTATEREKFAAHRQKGSACAACHAAFDDLGLAQETYDPLGRFRTTDKGKPIDASGRIVLRDGDVAFSDFPALVRILADAPDTQECFARQLLAYVSGRGRNDVSDCELRSIMDSYSRSGHRLDALVAAYARSPAFVLRRE